LTQKREKSLLEASALGGEEQINGITLRPVTAATWSLLSRLKNSFVTGEQDGDYAFAVHSFIYLHSLPISDIRRRIATIDDLRRTSTSGWITARLATSSPSRLGSPGRSSGWPPPSRKAWAAEPRATAQKSEGSPRLGSFA
jgi:hypothetical protein